MCSFIFIQKRKFFVLNEIENLNSSKFANNITKRQLQKKIELSKINDIVINHSSYNQNHNNFVNVWTFFRHFCPKMCSIYKQWESLVADHTRTFY
jgi:hypothetical protein